MDQRRKRVLLTIFQKVEILKKLQHGSSVKMIQEEYNVGKSTIYDLRSDKEKILQYAAECESANVMKNRRTMKPAKFDELDRVLYEWFKQRRSESDIRIYFTRRGKRISPNYGSGRVSVQR